MEINRKSAKEVSRTQSLIHHVKNKLLLACAFDEDDGGTSITKTCCTMGTVGMDTTHP